MPTNFNGGLTVDGIPILGGGALLTTGRVVFLDDSDATAFDDGVHGTPLAPFKTGAFALTQVVASNGDTIVVGPGHSESIATILALNTKVGVKFYDLRFGVSWLVGAGNSMQAPTSDINVARAASLTPATGNQTLFTIVGGSIELIAIYGVVTVVFPSTTNTLKLTAVPTGITATDLCTASATIASAAVGTVFSIDGTLADAMLITPLQTRIAQATRLVLHPGIIRLTTTGTSATGQIAWFMRYISRAPGAYVVAA